MNVTNPPFTLIIAVSLHLAYYSYSHVCLFLSLSLFCTDKVEVVREVSGIVRVLKKPGGGENTHSVFDVFFPDPMCISSLNQEKWLERRVIPFLMSVLDSKTNTPSSTQSMQNRLNSIPDENVPGRWITSCPVDLGELSLRTNWVMISPRAVQSSSSVLAKAIIKNKNNTGAMLSPYLTLTLNSMDLSTFPMMSLTILLSYMCLIAERSLEGAPYFTSMAIRSA